MIPLDVGRQEQRSAGPFGLRRGQTGRLKIRQRRLDAVGRAALANARGEFRIFAGQVKRTAAAFQQGPRTLLAGCASRRPVEQPIAQTPRLPILLTLQIDVSQHEH